MEQVLAPRDCCVYERLAGYHGEIAGENNYAVCGHRRRRKRKALISRRFNPDIRCGQAVNSVVIPGGSQNARP